MWVETFFTLDAHFNALGGGGNFFLVQDFEQQSLVERNGDVLGTVTVVGQVFPFDGVYHGKVSLYGSAVFVLIDFQSFVFEPMFHLAVGMVRHSRHIGFALLGYPMNTVLGTLVEGNAAQPVVHNQVILQTVFPYYGVLEAAFYGWIYPLVAQLAIRREAVLADPYTTATAYHEVRVVLTTGKCQVGKSFNNLSVARVEPEFTVGPYRTVFLVGDVISVDDIHHHSSVGQAEGFRVMAFTDGIHDAERAGKLVGNCMEHRRVAPEHVSAWRIFRPSTYIQVIFTVGCLEDVTTPERNVGMFNAIVHIPVLYTVCSPNALGGLALWHGKETVHKAGPFDELCPFGRALTFGYLGLEGYSHRTSQ